MLVYVSLLLFIITGVLTFGTNNFGPVTAESDRVTKHKEKIKIKRLTIDYDSRSRLFILSMNLAGTHHFDDASIFTPRVRVFSYRTGLF